MKKYTIPIVIFALTGIVISAALLIQHFFPEAGLGFLSCGADLANPCAEVSRSRFGTFLGMPLAAYGIFCYCIIIFTALVAEDAKESYYLAALMIISSLAILSLIIDVVLIGILISQNFFCQLCVATYIINLIICITSILWYKKIKSEEGLSIKEMLQKIFSSDETSSHKKASYSLYILFVIMIFFSLFLTSHILEIKSESSRPSETDIQRFLVEFYNMEEEELTFPEKGLTFGKEDARLNIVIFSDYLCSACYDFYKIEDYLLSKFPDSIKFTKYIYPLDKKCNPQIKRTLYKNSCTASRAILAASEAGIMKDYTHKHFEAYKLYKKKGYSIANAIVALRALPGQNMKSADFVKLMFEKNVELTLKDHIAKANKNKINATPTIFIDNRRIVGIPPLPFLEKLIIVELQKGNK